MNNEQDEQEPSIYGQILFTLNLQCMRSFRMGLKPLEVLNVIGKFIQKNFVFSFLLHDLNVGKKDSRH